MPFQQRRITMYPSVRNQTHRSLIDAFFPSSGSDSFDPRTDAWEDDEQYVLTFEIPGVAEEDLTVDVSDGRLSVKGERAREVPEDAKRRRRESNWTSFERNIGLPRDANVTGDVTATLSKGILTVYVPKNLSSNRIPVDVDTS